MELSKHFIQLLRRSTRPRPMYSSVSAQMHGFHKIILRDSKNQHVSRTLKYTATYSNKNGAETILSDYLILSFINNTVEAEMRVSVQLAKNRIRSRTHGNAGKQPVNDI